MDLWVVGAAAAAGYIAKHWKIASRDKDGVSELSSGASKYEKSETTSRPFRRLTPRKTLVEEISTNTCILDSASNAEAVSTSGYDENLTSLGYCDDHNVLSLSSLPLGFSAIQNENKSEGKNELSGCVGDDSSSEHRMSERESFHGCGSKKTSLRTKRSYGHFIRPLTSLDSCLMAQLYKEHTEMQEYVLSAFPSPSTTMRPLLVTDGNRIISRANGDSFTSWIGTHEKGVYKEDNVYGIPPLPISRNLDISKKIKSKTRKEQNERLSSSLKMGSERHFHLQNGSDGIVLFCLGISIGIISSLVANRSEVDKLKQLLKHTENLVQDLQEELEMKDSLTVKELENENHESQETCQSSIPSRAPDFSIHNVDNSINNDDRSYNEKADESSEYRSKIEAELEAELERLGLNMHTSSLEGRLSDLIELDPDFTADFAEGELKAGMVNGRGDATQSESNQDASGTSTTHSVNYAVSPRELSLRLHEVIQLRLEERVKELETALQDSQRKVQFLESESNSVQRNLSSNELRFSSGEESPIAKGYCSSMAKPLVMTLSGQALDAYDEAYEELMKINESEEEDSLPGIYGSNHEVGMHSFEHIMLSSENYGENSSLPHFMERTPKESFISHFSTLVEKSSRIQELIHDSLSDDEEANKQLIKQIVEKTKKGSPVVLNAQRVLFTMDEH